MAFDISIPSPSGPFELRIEVGTSTIFVGANGGGKTRLSAHIERQAQLNAHRISAHRALSLNPRVPKISEKQALNALRIGYADIPDDQGFNYRDNHRWQGKSAVWLLNDFDFLLQALFAEQVNTALGTHRKVRSGVTETATPTKFERLVEIWDRLLPHRQLHISGDDIEVSIAGSSVLYSGSEMSDGERAIFYTIGQTLMAKKDSLLIFDEPELHIHRSIMSKLWDELEAARSDCAFVYITHDLEFAASRVAQKYVIRDYTPVPTSWLIEKVPENSGFPEEIATLILGSRKPVLFVEGTDRSLDLATYRCCFPDWTVIPRGSCEEVLHSVVTMRRNAELTRITCSGIVDADDYDASDVAELSRLGVAVLPVSEIENIFLLRPVSRLIAQSEGYKGAELETQLGNLKTAIFATLTTPAALEKVVIRYCRRRIDRVLKKIDLSGASRISDLTTEYSQRVSAVNITAMAAHVQTRLETAIRAQDLDALLKIYDNKGLMGLVSCSVNTWHMYCIAFRYLCHRRDRDGDGKTEGRADAERRGASAVAIDGALALDSRRPC